MAVASCAERYDPEPVAVHDFEIQNGKAAPYGVYDIANNEGWVNVGIGPDTAAFAVESIRRWWFGLGGSLPQGAAPAHHGGRRRQQRLAPAAVEA